MRQSAARKYFCGVFFRLQHETQLHKVILMKPTLQSRSPNLGGYTMALSNFSAGIVAKFSTIANGVWIEETATPYGTIRAWRFDGKGRAEWACIEALKSGDTRFFGHQFTSKDFVLC